MFDKITEVNLLYDFYSQLLTEKQREIIRLYHCENLSLSEIGEDLSISRQGVYDALKSAERALSEYERKLGLVRKFADAAAMAKYVGLQIDELIRENGTNKNLTDKLCGIKKNVYELGQ